MIWRRMVENFTEETFLAKKNLKLSVDLSSIGKPCPSVQAIYEVTTMDYKSDPMEPLY